MIPSAEDVSGRRELGVFVPTIDAAIGMRTLSALEKENDIAGDDFSAAVGPIRR